MTASAAPAPAFRRPILALALLAVLAAGTAILASLAQSGFGALAVSDVEFRNEAGRLVRAKLLRPAGADSRTAAFPGAVYIHGYQNNRETSDPYCIELARRGFAVLEIDALGRGNSDPPGEPSERGFDPSYGARASLAYLRSLPYVDPRRTGMMGHSLGAEMAYKIARSDPFVDALVFSGYGFMEDAEWDRPRNALMIFGKYDEYRARMTRTRNFEREYMSSVAVSRAFPEAVPEFGKTYGDFAAGTARRVYMPKVTHVMESHDASCVAEALEWMRSALRPDPAYWIEARSQVWQIKEWATLVAMLACLASILPLADLLLRRGPFAAGAAAPPPAPAQSRRGSLRLVALNFLLSWLYLPLVLVLFAFHVYVARIDSFFPLMMANGIVFWFFAVGSIGLSLSLKSARKGGLGSGYRGIGLATEAGGLRAEAAPAGRSAALAALLFIYALLGQWLIERLLKVDFRFVFPFASDLTIARAPLVLLYFPFLFVGFLSNGILVHGRLRPIGSGRPWRDLAASWLGGWAVLAFPLVTILLVQYVPLLAGGRPVFIGPGASLVGFVLLIFPVLLKLLVATGLSAFLYERTGNVYAGAVLSALIVAWMFASSQVIAPLPI